MEKILKAIKELGIGRHDMATVAKKMESSATPQDVGRRVHRLNGRIVDGMRIKVESGGRKVFISLHNAIVEGPVVTATLNQNQLI